METNVCTECLCLVFILLKTLSLSGVASSIYVEVNITSNNPTDHGMPNDINVTLRTTTNSSTQFRLVRVDYDKLPMYSIETDQDGQKIKNENVHSIEDVAFYQDTKNRAVVQLSRANGDEGKLDDFIITRGQYRQGSATYSIQPLLRTKRKASRNDSQSDQRYTIKQVTVPPTMKSDFLVPPPEHHSSIPTNTGSFFPFWSKFHRRRRQAFSTYYIDVTAFLDSTCFRRFLKEAFYNETEALTKIREYYAFIFTGIDLIYQTIHSTTFQLRIRLTKIVIFKLPADFHLMYADSCNSVFGEMAMNTFTNFLNSTRGKDLVFPYDHAMLFSGMDLWSYVYLGYVKGLAYTGTLCRTDGTSSSMVESMGDYSEFYTAAHELGHSLSAEHDGSQNKCSADDRYVMAPSISDPTNGTKQNPWRLSSCTVDYITSFLNNLANTPSGRMCLSNTLDVIGDFPDVSHRLLGQEIPPEKQCQLRYGSWSYVCKNVDVSDICSGLYCFKTSSYGYTTCYDEPALSGTTCGCGKICNQGACITDPLAPGKCNRNELPCTLNVMCSHCKSTLRSVDCTLVDNWSNCTMDYCYEAVSRSNCSRTCADVITTLAPSIVETPKDDGCYNDKTYTFAGMTCDTISKIFCVFDFIYSVCCALCDNFISTLPANWCYDNEAFTYANYTCQTIQKSFCDHAFVNLSCCETCNHKKTPEADYICQDDPTFMHCGFTCQTVTPSLCNRSLVNQSCCETCSSMTTTVPTTTTSADFLCHDDPEFGYIGMTCQTIAPIHCIQSFINQSCCETCNNYKSTTLPMTTTSADKGCFDNETFIYAGMTCLVISPSFCTYGFVNEPCCKTCANYTEDNRCYDNTDFYYIGMTCQTLKESDCDYWFANLSCCKTCNYRNTTVPDYRCHDDHNFTYNSWTCQTIPPNYCTYLSINQSCCETCRYKSTTLPTTTTTSPAYSCYDDHGFTYNGWTCQTIPTDYCSISYFNQSCCEMCNSDQTTHLPLTTTLPAYSTRMTTSSATCEDDPNFSISGQSCYIAMLSSTNYCYNPSVSSACCASCARRFTRISGCEFGDWDRNLCASISSCQGHEVECCETCRSNAISLKETHRAVWNSITLCVLYMTASKYLLLFVS